MLTIRLAPAFRDWLRSLKDKRAISRITIRMERVASGNLGDVKSVGDGVSEMRIPYGTGYRLY
jgi:putative addiction module killer protein